MSNGSDAHSDPEVLVQRFLDTKRADLKDLILVEYSGMVERLARRFAGIEPFEDLVQVGYIGLLNALTKFDPSAGVRFNTYATYLVAGEIKHYLRDRSQTIRQPAWLQELRHKVNRAAGLLQSQLSRVPTEREIAEEIGVSETAVREVFLTQDMLKLASLDSTPQDDDGESDVERLDAADFCPEQLSMEDRLVLESAMGQLRDLEREVLLLFHFESLNQTEIAGKLGISCNYVSHILRQSLSKLRKILHQENQRDRVLRRQAMEVDYEVVDDLTGAYTEPFFRARLEEEVHRASSQEGAVGVVVVNFTGLPTLQKFYGPASVDAFLSDAAEFLKDAVRRLDLVCRFGESGFAVILPSVGNNVPMIQRRLMAKIGTWVVDRCTASSPVRVEIGHRAFPEDGRNGKELLERLQLETISQPEAA